MKQEMMTIVAQEQLTHNIFALTLKGQLVEKMETPGQFLHIRVPRSDLLLRRPISISQIDQIHQTCQIIYRIEGAGTEVLSQLIAGDTLDVMGPLGNGFQLDQIEAGMKVFIVGGGIGIPPLYALSQAIRQKGAEAIHFLGYASANVMYRETAFKKLGETRIATDDGSYGVQGNVGNLLLAAKATPDAVFACGNQGLLKTVACLYQNLNNVQLSLEARMACGMGACYACVCHLKEDETGKKSVKICDEGPVFQARKVVLE